MLPGVCPACGLRPLSEAVSRPHGHKQAEVPRTHGASVAGRSFPARCTPAGAMSTSLLRSSHARDTRAQERQNSPSRASTDWAPCSSQTAVSAWDKVLPPCLSCLGGNGFVSTSSSLCCPSLKWRSGYVYTYSTKIKRHKYTQNAADSEQLIRVPDAGKTRMLEGWSGSSGCDGLCCL